jgi:hypothetical protein
MNTKTIISLPADTWSAIAFVCGAAVVGVALVSLVLVLFGVATMMF